MSFQGQEPDNSSRRRGEERTTIGWDEGQYSQQSDGYTTKRIIIVAVVAAMVLCVAITVSVGAYYYF